MTTSDPLPCESHPAVRFERIPIVEGPLSHFRKTRFKILQEVVESTLHHFQRSNLDLLLGEALYQERKRLAGQRRLSLSYGFTYPRQLSDQRLWKMVQATLRASPTQSDRSVALEQVLQHYVSEIGGRFHPWVYRFAVYAVPWGFSWLLNAASVKRFLPWGMSVSLQSRLRILGEIPLLQDLSKRGTILLVPTHQSNIDSVLIGYIIYLMSLPPFSYGAGLNLFTNPFINFLMSNLGAYTVDRQKRNQIYLQSLKNYSQRVIEEGIHSIFFPGGGRSRSGAIETHLKLGLLGSALQAQINNFKKGKPNPNIYVVPMTTSYHFVLEAGSLVEQYLSHLGKHRFMADQEEEPPIVGMLRFFWRFFSSSAEITVRIGKALDLFGNEVDETGRSLGPNGTFIDPQKWLTTRGELRADSQRDKEYTRTLGQTLVRRYYQENTVLTSHFVAFAYFTALRKRYTDLDLFRFLRLSSAQRAFSYDDFLKEAQSLHQILKQKAQQGEFFLSKELQQLGTPEAVEDGIRHLGVFHTSKILKVSQGVITTDDLSILYYYRNRLTGYGLTLFGEQGRAKRLRGQTDEQGFLA